MPRASSPILKGMCNSIVVAILLTHFAEATALARDTWPVHGKLQGKKGQASEDVSGIACTSQHGFPRRCVVIDDNLQAAQFVEVKDGEIQAGKMLPVISDHFRNKAIELDGEGVAYSDGFFYVIGSHGHPRDSENELGRKEIAARIEASSQIVRFRSNGGEGASAIERTSKLRDVIKQQAELERYRDKRLEKNGLTIEGIAVTRGRVFAGFRGPSLDGGLAPVLSVTVDGLFGNAAPEPRLWKLPLGEGIGVRDLTVFGDGMFVLAGPTSSEPGPYAIYWWDGKSNDARLLRDIADAVGKKGKRKAEALLPLEEDSSGVRVLILFDGRKEGAPISITVPRP